jgi:hypothetical protein
VAVRVVAVRVVAVRVVAVRVVAVRMVAVVAVEPLLDSAPLLFGVGLKTLQEIFVKFLGKGRGKAADNEENNDGFLHVCYL